CWCVPAGGGTSAGRTPRCACPSPRATPWWCGRSASDPPAGARAWCRPTRSHRPEPGPRSCRSGACAEAPPRRRGCRRPRRSYRHRCLDALVVLVALDLEILELVAEDRLRPARDPQPRVGERLAGQLPLHLLDMVVVDVAVPTGPHEVADGEIRLLGHHVRQQRVAGDVERDAEEHVRAALV